MTSSSSSLQQHFDDVPQQQGVLFKRRDIFKNRWRPRWFVLQAEQGIMTYYLLNPASESRAAANSWRVMEAQSATTTTTTALATSPAVALPFFVDHHASGCGGGGGSVSTSSHHLHNHNNNHHINHNNHNAPRRRTTSVDSNVSENSVDYDVVPRGTIYLMGCTVRMEDDISRPADELYAFTITPPTQTEAPYYLAAKTPELRREWMDKISVVCRQIRHSPGDGNNHNNNINNNDSITSGINPISEGMDASSTASATNGRVHHTRPTTNGHLPRPVVNGNVTTSVSGWRSTDTEEHIFEGVPSPLVNRIQTVLRSCLPLLLDNDESAAHSSQGWTLLFQNRDGVTAYQRTDAQQRSMIKSVALLHHHPKQVLNLLVDIKRRQTFETNLERHERLVELNPHTFLDHYAYHPVWPTMGRDFAVVAHWQVLQRDMQERAIVILGCSCPEADALKPPSPTTHVRATLFVTMTLLKLVQGNKCQLTRILSYDLEGSVPKQLTGTILQRQAQMPALLARHLSELEPIPDDRLTDKGGPLTNEVVIRDVLNHFREGRGPSRQGVRRRLELNETIEAMRPLEQCPVEPCSSTRTLHHAVQEFPQTSYDSFTEIIITAIILLTPVVLFRVARWFHFPVSDVIFLASTYLAIRLVVLRQLGTQVDQGSLPTTLFVCRLSVDLDGVLRFIAAAKELQQDKHNSPEVSVVHILVAALSRAVSEEKTFAYRRRIIPWLMIDGLFRRADDTCDVSVMETDSSIMTLEHATKHTVQEIADYYSKAKKAATGLNTHQNYATLDKRFNIAGVLQRKEIGQCLVLSPPGSEDCSIDVDVADLPLGVNVAAVLGGVKLVRDATSSSTTATFTDSTASPIAPPKPVLSLSLTIQAPLGRIDSCRRLAERVQTLVQNPELFHEHSI